MMLRLLVIVAGLVAGAHGVELLSWEAAEAKADATLARMTAEERHSLMIGIGWQVNESSFMGIGAVSSGHYMGNTMPIPRLGVPPLKLHDAGNGFRPTWMSDWNDTYFGLGTSTCWPSALSLASSWDEELVERVAAAIAREFRAKGANVVLGPGVQVHRVARNGRNFEYMSGEDPYLGSRLAAAYVHGIQNEGLLACAKHWAFNEQETERFGGDSEVDERTAWELYYPPFEAAVEAGVGSFMCSYNRVNGTYACESEALLRRDLKQRMGFRGFVVSDWWATHSTSVEHGLDQEMPGSGVGVGWRKHGPHFSHEELELAEKPAEMSWWSMGYRWIKWQLARFTSDFGEHGFFGRFFGNVATTASSGAPREEVFRDPTRRILAAMYRARLDEQPGCTPGSRECMDQLVNYTWHEHVELNREAAARSVILLQNNGGLLPLRPGGQIRKVAFIGNLTDQALHYSLTNYMPPPDAYSGGGSGHVGPSWGHVRPLHRLRDRAEELGFEVLTSNCLGAGECNATEDERLEEALRLAREADVVVLVAAATSTEGEDRSSLSFDPSGHIDRRIAAVASERPTAVLMQVPGAILMPWRDKVAAIACLFLGGDRTGYAWSSLLFGDVAPSGKLPIMMPKTEESTILPGNGKRVRYSEGLFTSYRSPSAEKDSAFPFGHGLTFTKFKYGVPTVKTAADCAKAKSIGVLAPREILACIEVVVTNAGEQAGVEVAQAYLQFPPEANEPRLVLRGHHRTALLEPGAGEAVLFALTRRDLSIYHAGGWHLRAAGAMLHVGASSADLRGVVPIPPPPVAAGEPGKRSADEL